MYITCIIYEGKIVTKHTVRKLRCNLSQSLSLFIITRVQPIYMLISINYTFFVPFSNFALTVLNETLTYSGKELPPVSIKGNAKFEFT